MDNPTTKKQDDRRNVNSHDFGNNAMHFDNFSPTIMV
jgi:hypothetical protein